MKSEGKLHLRKKGRGLHINGGGLPKIVIPGNVSSTALHKQQI